MTGEEGWCCRACRELSPAWGRSRCMAVGMFAVRSEAATLDQGISSGYISRLVHDGASDSDRQAGEIVRRISALHEGSDISHSLLNHLPGMEAAQLPQMAAQLALAVSPVICGERLGYAIGI